MYYLNTSRYKIYQAAFSEHEFVTTAILMEHEFGMQLASYIESEKLRGFLLGYSKAIIIYEKRTGSLFQKAFRRKHIESNSYKVIAVLAYIHYHPIHYNYSSHYKDYQWSSYRKYIDSKSQIEFRIKDWFDGITNFIDYQRIYKLRKYDVEWFESGNE